MKNHGILVLSIFSYAKGVNYPMDTAECMTVSDVAKRLKITPQSVRSLIRDNYLAAERIGKQWLVSNKALSDYIQNYDVTIEPDDHPRLSDDLPDIGFCLRTDRELIIILNEPVQSFQTPEEDPFFFGCQLFSEVRVIVTVLRPVLCGQDDLTSEETVGMVMERCQRAVPETEETDIQLALITLDALLFHIHLAF